MLYCITTQANIQPKNHTYPSKKIKFRLKMKKENKVAAVVIFSINTFSYSYFASQVNAVDETKKIILLFISHLITLIIS